MALVTRFAGRLRYPWLLLIVTLAFIVDLIVPDLIPLADEILLGLATLLLASRTKRREPGAPD